MNLKRHLYANDDHIDLPSSEFYLKLQNGPTSEIYHAKWDT